MSWTTHDVTNVVSELKDYNLYDTDVVLQEAVRREGAGWREAALRAHGQALGREATLRDADLANRHPPELQAFDRVGRRTDFIEFHEAWHRLMAMYREQGLISLCYADTREGRWAAQAAGMYLHGQIEAGSQCPATMTTACIPVLQQEGALFERIGPKLLSNAYDASDRPWSEKASVYIGMGMTEKQGGSDVRRNTTQAAPDGHDAWGARYRLTGHKWFFSAPMCDAFLVLAQSPGGLSCFFLPRVLPDGTLNAIRIQRLKDKLGNKANASSEVEFHGASAWLVGEEGRGVPQILEMGTMTRLDCALGTSGLMRQAVALALNHTAQRSAFGKLLIDQPRPFIRTMDYFGPDRRRRQDPRYVGPWRRATDVVARQPRSS